MFMWNTWTWNSSADRNLTKVSSHGDVAFFFLSIFLFFIFLGRPTIPFDILKIMNAMVS